MIKFSVVIPTYNRANIISKALESVFAQSYTNYEIIVVDDGSTDSTQQILKQYAGSIKYYKQKNQGAASARNLGIEKSKGDYIAFLDSDDSWFPEKLKKVIDSIEIKPETGLFYSDFKRIDREGRLLKKENCKHIVGKGYPRILFYNFIGTSTVVVKRECFNKCGLFDEQLFRAQDWDMWIRISREFFIYHIPVVLVEHMWDSKGSISSSKESLLAQMKVVERALKTDQQLNHKQRRVIKAKSMSSLGLRYLRHGEKNKSQLYFKKSIYLNPFSLKNYLYWCLVKFEIVDCLPEGIKILFRIS
jgi:glycosyltransferase involved in cell wall biosynthesis